MAFTSTPSPVRTRIDTGTARTTWETRGTHTPRRSRKRWYTSACPHCCGHISPSRSPGFRPPEPRAPHVCALPHHATKVPSPQTDTNAHVHRACRHARKVTRAQARPKRPPHGLSTCAGHAIRPQSSATAPTTALQPNLKSNRCGTFPNIEPDFEGVGRAPTARRRILVVSGP